MRMHTLFALGMLLLFMAGCSEKSGEVTIQNENYTFNRSPLQANPYARLPLGDVKPGGWLLHQLELMKEGMTGHLDELYPSVLGERNGWLGGDGDGWERGPYWLDGLVPLAYILEDSTLMDKAKPWIEWTLQSQTDSGYFGPVPFETPPEKEAGLQRSRRRDWWPHMVMLKVLQQYHSATDDERVIGLMSQYFRYQLQTLPEKPLDHWSVWARNRGGENLASVYWLYNRTGDEFLLELGELLYQQTDPWTRWFSEGRLIPRANSLRQAPHWSSIHGVNLAMAIKQPGVYYQQAKEDRHLQAVDKALADLEEFHGQVQGMYSADELLHGPSPTQGVELCSVVELMFSLENLLRIRGKVSHADHLERIAYNALPAQIADDFNSRQYFQQANQVLISHEERNFITDHSGTDLCFGLFSGYPCCTTNMHQGWPKFVRNLWYATANGGAAALIYAPSEVDITVADGVQVHFREETGYPFDDEIQFTYTGPDGTEFPLHLRIPGWCDTAGVSINGQSRMSPSGGQIIQIDRMWTTGDQVLLHLPMKVNTNRWHENSAGVERGPLVYALNVPWEENRVDLGPRYGNGTAYTPAEFWNVGLLQSVIQNPEKEFGVQRRSAVPPQPWTPENIPIRLTTRGKRIPAWEMYNDVAGPLPNSPVGSPAPEEEITLIPYGATTLRIGEFPVVR